MARFFALDHSKRGAVRASVLLGVALGVMVFIGISLQADTAPAKAAGAPAAAVATKPVAPPPAPDTLNLYGKILTPSDDVAHPLKLNMPFPGIGELKIPSQDELKQRESLEQLANLSDEDIRTKLAAWPPYSKMKLSDEGLMLVRIEQFKEQRANTARARAHDLGLILTPEQEERFEQEYWEKRLAMDEELAKQFEPVFKARRQKMKEELFRDFSTPGTTVPAVSQTPKPAPPVAQDTSKPATAQPIAQAPH